MIPFEEALLTVLREVPASRKVACALQEALGCVLASPVRVKDDHPGFHQSAMDGYAFAYAAWDKKSPLSVKAVVAAGDSTNVRLRKGEAAMVFTGAKIPAGADTVVIREKVSVMGDVLHIHDSALLAGANVRLRGSHMRRGSVALPAGHSLNAPSMAFLAAMGAAQVKIHDRPRVAVIVTGNELVPPGERLRSGQVYECNSIGLQAALEDLPVVVTHVMHCRDVPREMLKALRKAAASADMVLFTGGVSAGDHDYVGEVLTDFGVKKVFHKVRQKPGKPVWFGRKGKQLFFGLPGNPASVLTCFYTLVRPALQKWAGEAVREPVCLKLEQPYTGKAGMTMILKAKAGEQSVRILGSQESYKLDAFAHANALVLLGPEQDCLKAGENVQVIRL